MHDVRQWLQQLGLLQYAEAFERDAIEPDLLSELNDGDLQELGVHILGHRKRLLKAIDALRGAGAIAPSQSPAPYTPKYLADRILTSRAALEGERKQVTILFADLKGSMELLADRDPETGRRILDPVLERMMEAVHHYEGTVNRVMGDGIMALFGAPLAHEDHAVRACYASLRMQERVKQYAQAVRRAEAVTVQIRVGLSSGEVLVRAIGDDLQMDVVGQPANLAARVEQLAAPGSILLTSDTLNLAEGYIRVASLGPIHIRGLPEPVEVYELSGAGTARTRLQAAALRGLTRFVGRDAELEQLRSILARADAGHTQVAAIVGEAGVGKSRLVYEFTHSHRLRDWLILEAPSVSYGKATSYLPVIGLLKGYFKIADRDDHREMREKVTGKVFTLDESLRPQLPALLALLDVPIEDSAWHALDPTLRRQRTLDAVKRLLLRETQVQPLLLVFEDLHWVDGETQALLHSLVESMSNARFLLLVTFRPEYEHGWGSKTAYAQLRLDSLSAESTSEFLVALLGPDSSLAPLTRMLVERGNPFFLEETVRSLVETGALVGQRGGYRLTRPVEGLQVPSTVQTMLEARVDRLPPQEKQLLQASSVIGKDVPHLLLAAVMGQPDDVMRRGLTHLQEAEFLYQTQLYPDLEYSFKHALTHEVTYGSLLRDRRRQLHAQIVDAIEKLYADRVNEHVERLAHHALRGQLWEQAARYGRQAGAKAFDRSAAREALIHLEHAAAALQELPEGAERTRQLIDTCFEQRNALFALGDFVQMGKVLDEARSLAEKLADPRRLGWSLAYLAHRHTFLAEHAGAIDAAKRAGSAAETVNDLGLRVVSSYYLGQALWFAGDPRAAAEPLRMAIALIECGPPGERFGMTALSAVVARWALAQILAEQGEFHTAIAAGEEGLRIAQSAGDRQSEIYARYGLGYAYLRRGEFAAAKRVLEPGLALCRELEIRVALPFVAASLGCAYLWSSPTGAAVPLLEEAIEAFNTMAIKGLHSLASTFLAEAYLVQGRINEACEQAGHALAAARARQERGWEAWALSTLGAIHAHEPADGAQAGEEYRQALSLATELGMRPLIAHCHIGLGRLYAKSSEHSAAKEHLLTAASLYREMEMRFWLERVREALDDGNQL